jgi:hypothetical protein
MTEQLLQTYLPAILVAAAMIALWIWKPDDVRNLVKWTGAILTEADGNGGKASASRVIGVYAAWNIIQQSWQGAAFTISPVLWDLFMVTMGYAILSKALNTMSPAVLAWAQGFRDKYGTKTAKE